MSEFCAIKAKSYAFKLDMDNEARKAKGTKKCVVKRHVTLLIHFLMILNY